MTPTEAANPLVNSYKAFMLNDFGVLASTIATEMKESNDLKHIEFSKQKLQLAEAFIQILLDYTYSTTDTDTNLMTKDEFAEIQKHLNRLLNNLYWLD